VSISHFHRNEVRRLDRLPTATYCRRQGGTNKRIAPLFRSPVGTSQRAPVFADLTKERKTSG